MSDEYIEGFDGDGGNKGWRRIFDWRVRTWLFARLFAFNTGMKDTELHDIVWRSASGMFNDCMAFCVNLHLAGGFLGRII